MAKDFVIPAFFDVKRAGIQAFSQPVEFKAKVTGPPAPGLDTFGAGFAGVTHTGFFAPMWEFQSFFITLLEVSISTLLETSRLAFQTSSRPMDFLAINSTLCLIQSFCICA